jgi:hypothetical protein
LRAPWRLALPGSSFTLNFWEPRPALALFDKPIDAFKRESARGHDKLSKSAAIWVNLML